MIRGTDEGVERAVEGERAGRGRGEPSAGGGRSAVCIEPRPVSSCPPTLTPFSVSPSLSVSAVPHAYTCSCLHSHKRAT